MRHFRATVDTYLVICASMDQAYGYPNAATKTERALPVPSSLPVDSSGRLYLAVSKEQCGFLWPSQMLPQLIGSGAIEEVTEVAYLAALPQSPSPVI